MKIAFTISNDDNLEPFNKLINEYGNEYLITDYSVYKIGFINSKWIYISIDLIKATATLLHEYNSEPRRKTYRPIEIIAAIQLELDNFDKPATWEESLNEKE